MRRHFEWTALATAAIVAALVGCTPTQYAEQADDAAFSTLKQTNRFALGRSGNFRVAYKPFTPTTQAASQPTTMTATQAATQPTTQPVICVGSKVLPLYGDQDVKLNLDECMEVAFRNSRSFQTRKETLYSAALALANTRRGWTAPTLGGPPVGLVATAAEGTNEAAAGTAEEFNAITAGGGGSLLTANAQRVVTGGNQVNTASLSAQPTLTQYLVDGGVATLGLSTALASDLLGWRSTRIGTAMDATFTQPLLRNAWNGFAYEKQYRLERNLVFNSLEYERFTQEFGVDILTRYYAVLQQRDTLENERANIKRLQETLSLTKTLVEGGVRSPIEQDQAEANLLDARVRFQTDLQSYQDLLDHFKITLGLPVVTRMETDYPTALEELNRVGPKPVTIEEKDALAVAMVTRPDVLRQAAALRDADRDVEIAANQFLPELDATLSVAVTSKAPHRAQSLQFDRPTRSAGLDFDYELDQTNHRDAYRNSLLARDKTQRIYDEFIDTLRLEIRQSYRAMLQSRLTYELQLRNLEIAKRRRKLAVLQQKEGEASARDVLEAEESLRQTQNGVTGALISYTTTRLNFMTTLGLIQVDEKGNLHERTEPLKFDRIQNRYPYLARP